LKYEYLNISLNYQSG